MQQQLLRVCVVGSGPAGMYSAKYLLRHLPNATIDVIERFPVPFGLVRFGVAPDHPEVKSCQEDFAEVLQNERVRFFGNLTVNQHVSVNELKQMYDSILLAHGPADEDQKIGLKDAARERKHVLGAREFVNWYNAFPLAAQKSTRNDGVDFAKILAKTTDVVIVGNGNVALDCARILLEDLSKLRETDISQRALLGLAQSKVNKVSIVGRRGHPNAAFTMKELRELTKLNNVQFICQQNELDASNAFDFESSRPAKRMNELLRKNVQTAQREKQVCLRFLLSPSQVIEDEGTGALTAMRFHRTKVLENGSLETTAETQDIPCQLVLRSVGYETEDLLGHTPGFSPRTGYGKTELEPGIFSVGWCKRGPKGIIGTNVTDAHETVDLMLKRLEEGKLIPASFGKRMDLKEFCEQRKIPIVDWPAYLRIDAEERARGERSEPRRPRIKLESVGEMLEHVGGSGGKE